MSIALESSGNGIELSGFIGGISSRSSVFESPDSGWKVAGALPDNRLTAPAPSANLSEKATEESASCSSSIGRNSESSERFSESENGDEEIEVQSSYKGPLDTMDALEDSLPIRQGISKFYCGKSKSFTSLADAASSAKDLSKPENCFNRKRKNLLATNNFFNRNQNSLRHSWGGIPKKPANSSRTTLALGVSMSSSASNTSEESSEASRLPPLPPHGKSSVNALSPPRRSFTSRSFSLTDLHSTNTDPAIWPKLH